MRVLAALWTMAARNRRTTALGAAAALAYLCSRYGLELTPGQQEGLACGLMIFIGLVAGDAHNRRRRK